jgi:hypothetical protein
VNDDELDAIILEAFKVPPAYDHHYPLAPNQLAYLIYLVAAAEREACARVCEQEALLWPQSKDFRLCAAAIRARG